MLLPADELHQFINKLYAFVTVMIIIQWQISKQFVEVFDAALNFLKGMGSYRLTIVHITKCFIGLLAKQLHDINIKRSVTDNCRRN